MVTRYLSYGRKYLDYGFYNNCYVLKINKVPKSRIKVPELHFDTIYQ